MNQVEEYRKSLRATADALRPKYISVADLADALNVSRQTAYNRIEVLKKLVTVSKRTDRIGVRGPKTLLYRVTAGVVS